MEICMHATHQAILCILFIVASWAHVNAQKHSGSDENTSKEEGEMEELRNALVKIKTDCKKLENRLITHTRTLESLEDIEVIKRGLQKNISSMYEKVVNDFRSELAGVKHELVEDRNSLHQKFMAPLENLNQTVQLLAHKQDEAFSLQVAELKAEQQKQRALVLQETSQLRENYTSEIAMLRAEQKKQASAAFELFERSKNMEEALLQFTGNYTSKVAELKAEQQKQRALVLQETSQLREKYKSEVAELKAEQQKQRALVLQETSQLRENYKSEADLRVKRAISNKCSLNVHHKPEGGRIDLLMVMDPPNTDPAACN